MGIHKRTIFLLAFGLVFLIAAVTLTVVMTHRVRSTLPPVLADIVINEFNPEFSQVQTLGLVSQVPTGIQGPRMLALVGSSPVVLGEASVGVVLDDIATVLDIVPEGLMYPMSASSFLVFTSDSSASLVTFQPSVQVQTTSLRPAFETRTAVVWKPDNVSRIAAFKKESRSVSIFDLQGVELASSPFLLTDDVDTLVPNPRTTHQIVAVDFTRNQFIVLDIQKNTIHNISSELDEVGDIVGVGFVQNTLLVFLTAGFATFSGDTFDLQDRVALPFFGQTMFFDVDPVSGVFIASTNTSSLLAGRVLSSGQIERKSLCFLKLDQGLIKSGGPCRVLSADADLITAVTVSAAGVVRTSKFALPL